VKSFSIAVARHDYGRFLAEFGFEEQRVLAAVSNPADQVPMPDGFKKLCLGASEISGLGMLAAADIAGGELIAPARLDGMRTPAGRYTNHSHDPNAEFQRAPSAVQPSGDLIMVALRSIKAGEEVLIDYRQAGRVNGWMVSIDPVEVETTRRERAALLESLQLQRQGLDPGPNLTHGGIT
jgi:hypothetical protein